MGLSESKMWAAQERAELLRNDYVYVPKMESASQRQVSEENSLPQQQQQQQRQHKERGEKIERQPAAAAAKDRTPSPIPLSEVGEWQNSLLRDPRNRLAAAALSAADPRAVLRSRGTQTPADQQLFSVRIPLEGAPPMTTTDQNQSARSCWLTATTNVFRVALMRRHGLATFWLSQAYLFFWDKLERSNWFLEQIIATVREDLEDSAPSRLVQHLLADPAGDAGQWDMVVTLVRKYGLVPHALYPDGWSASTSAAALNDLIAAKLREFALSLRATARRAGGAAALSDAKAGMLRQIHGILALALGPPPPADGEFTWTYADKDARVRTVRTTPRRFAEGIYGGEVRVNALTGRATSTAALFAGPLEDMVSLVHDPRHAPLTRLAVDRLGNVVGARAVSYVNVDMATIKAACMAMLRAGRPVLFGCDARRGRNDGDGDGGIFDLDAIDYRLGFGPDAGDTMVMDKAARLATGHSLTTHAMVLTGVHMEAPPEGGQERPVRWRVENSGGGGSGAGEKGWYVMTDRWMDEWVYQAVVDPRFLSRKVRDVVKAEPLVLPLWDPMGTLA